MARKSGVQRTPHLVLATAVVIGTTGILSGCASEPDPRVAYCTDANGTIVDEKYCDDTDPTYHTHGGVGYFIWYGNYAQGLPVGSRLPSDPSMGSRAPANDAAARSRIGVPSSGKVSAGKSGGFGTGKSGGGGFGSGKGGSGS
jgi:hypothetical protein